MSRAVAVALAIGVPHVAIGDGRLLCVWLRRVKRIDGDVDPMLVHDVDQAAHMLCLWVVAAAGVAAR